jgi:hypothetical protein
MERLVNEIIQILNTLNKNGELNNYFIEDNERKWINLIKDILTNKFNFPWGNDTSELANEIYNNYVITWKGQQKFKGMLNTESKNKKKINAIIRESIYKVLNESYLTGKPSGFTKRDYLDFTIGYTEQLLDVLKSINKDSDPQTTRETYKDLLKKIEFGLQAFDGFEPFKYL